MITKCCETCGKNYSVSPRSAKSRWCSRACFYTARFGRFGLTAKCLECGIDFKCTQWRLDHGKAKYCSWNCQWINKRIGPVVECAFCGIQFHKKLSQVTRSLRHFCSHACSRAFHVDKNHSNFVGGIGYGREWRAIANAIRERDKACRKCGKTELEIGYKLHIHHKIPFSRFGYKNRLIAHQSHNLIALCRSCHKRIEEAMICKS